MKAFSTIDVATRPALDFRNIEEDDIPLLRRFFHEFPSRSCDYTLGGVMMWREYFDYKLAVAGDSLIIMGRNPEDGQLLFYEPRGPLSPEAYFEMVREYCHNHCEKYKILMPQIADIVTADTVMTGPDKYVSDWREYVYDAEKISSLAGRKMEKKRNHLNFFINNYQPFELQRIENAIVPELITFMLAFEMTHNDSELADYESRQVIDVLRRYDEYGFDGIAVRKDGKIIGFAFGEKVGDTFFEHVEKGDIAYRGIYQLLASRMARLATSLYPDVQLINREEDMGDESLRQSKISYHPSAVVCKKIVV